MKILVICSKKFYPKIEEVKEYLENNEILVKYDDVKSVTPGQACVLYNNEECLGGGIIKEVRKNIGAIRERLSYSHIPNALKGPGIAFIITGLMGIAFMIFSGIQL